MSITYYQNAKSEAVNRGWLSQNQREMLVKEMYSTQALKKISVDERSRLFENINKGKNLNGGTYGVNNTENTMRRS